MFQSATKQCYYSKCDATRRNGNDNQNFELPFLSILEDNSSEMPLVYFRGNLRAWAKA